VADLLGVLESVQRAATTSPTGKLPHVVLCVAVLLLTWFMASWCEIHGEVWIPGRYAPILLHPPHSLERFNQSNYIYIST
jgi:hypothetical protein